MKKLLSAITILIAFTSCNNYYKAITTTGPASSVNIEELKMKNKYFILRDGNQAFAMKNISFSADQKTMQCSLNPLPDEHKLHLTKGRNGKMIYTKKAIDQDETFVLNEVHVYIAPGGNTVAGLYTVALDKLQKIEVIEKDKVKTSNSHALGIGISVGAAAIAAVVVAVAVASY